MDYDVIASRPDGGYAAPSLLPIGATVSFRVRVVVETADNGPVAP
jgi:hypothetical protein